jgi:hypothetical protein
LFERKIRKKKKRFQIRFSKVSAVINRLGKFWGARHTTGKGQRGENLLFMSFHANPNEFEFLGPDDDGENEATGNTTNSATR